MSLTDLYQAQGILGEAEWEDFMGHLRTELPTTFRVTGSRAYVPFRIAKVASAESSCTVWNRPYKVSLTIRSHAESINDIIKTAYVPNMQNVEYEGKRYGPPEQISWYVMFPA